MSKYSKITLCCTVIALVVAFVMPAANRTAVAGTTPQCLATGQRVDSNYTGLDVAPCPQASLADDKASYYTSVLAEEIVKPVKVEDSAADARIERWRAQPPSRSVRRRTFSRISPSCSWTNLPNMSSQVLRRFRIWRKQAVAVIR